MPYSASCFTCSTFYRMLSNPTPVAPTDRLASRCTVLHCALLQPTASYNISPLAVRYHQPTASYSRSPFTVCCRVMSCGQVWSNRWVVLHKTDGLLYYSSNTDREPRGAIAVQAIAQSLSADHHDCNLCAVLRGVMQTVSFHCRMRCVCRIWRVWTRFPVPSDLSGSRFGCS